MGGPDLREVQQNLRLRRRVADLEAEVDACRTATTR
jgi:hypothetical protein